MHRFHDMDRHQLVQSPDIDIGQIAPSDSFITAHGVWPPTFKNTVITSFIIVTRIMNFWVSPLGTQS